MQTRTPTSSRPLVAVLVALATALVATGCLTLTSGRNYAVGFETTRANVVILKKATNYLYGEGRKHGSAKSREILLGATPDSIPISTAQRAVICSLSLALCLSANHIGRTIVGWFKSDIRHRSDFWEALSYAGRHDRCFAWTFIPSRNLTHKGTGTSGCRTGVIA